MSRLKNALLRFIESLESRTLLSNAAGTLDPTFGPDGTGYLLTDIGGGASYAVNDMGIDPSGRIIVIGDIMTAAGSSTPNDIFVLAFTPGGLPDISFGSGGKLVINLGQSDSARALVIRPDGKFIIGGFTKLTSSSSEDLLLMRLNSDGSFDSSFGTAGKTITDIAHFNDRLLDLAVLSDGRILGSASNEISAVGRVVRFLPDGTLDTSFGSGGFSVTAPFSFPVDPTGLMVQNDGKIIIGGRINAPNYGNILSLGRFNADGTVDNSFAFSWAASPITSIGSRTYFAPLADGKFLVGTGGDLLRFNADGSHDLSFYTGGVWRAWRGTPVQPGDARGLIIDAAGKSLTTGITISPTYSDLTILRQHPNGLPDPSFGNESGFDRIDLGGKPEQGFALALQSPDRLVVAGLTTIGTQKLFVLRVDESNSPNVPPIPRAGGPYQIREGGLMRLSGSATDSDGAIDHYEWDFNYDGINFDVDATANKSDFYDPLGQRPIFNATGIDGPSTRTIAMRVFDSQYASVIDTTTLTITNSAPALLASGSPRIIPGQPYTVTFSASPDPGQDTITSWQIDWGDGSAVDILPASATS
ncbi:MAG TPA: hypothetical protein VGP94_07010, partial [Tepidisphaeraceae bacterium]|nr:hypothetical protein [Tepidisphaeraceae bacterium]